LRGWQFWLSPFWWGVGDHLTGIPLPEQLPRLAGARK